jgi:branched-chain amino acid transport system permease protein
VTPRSPNRFLAYAPILAVAALLALVPLATSANTVLNAMTLALLIALTGQGWNILGGYGGQFSFGNAAFFGTGAYGTAILQARYGMNAYVAFAAAVGLGAAVGAAIGFLSFRAGLRGSYFALVTLAFAEVFRIVANASPLTGGASGTLLKLDVRPENFQFASRAIFFWIALGLVTLVLIVTRALERSRFGAYLVAIRENENAAKALGIDTLKVKLQAITLSAAITAAAGAFYAQYFLFVDSRIAYGAAVSVEALLAPIIGGLGTVYGPLVGALALHGLAEGAKALTGRVPGLDVALYGSLLVLAIAFAPKGVQGLAARLGRGLSPRRAS